MSRANVAPILPNMPLGSGNKSSLSKEKTLNELLEKLELDAFVGRLRDELQITRIEHLEYVKPKELEKIGMSKPAIRRLLDAANNNKSGLGSNKLSVGVTRPPPPPPIPQCMPHSSIEDGDTLAKTKVNKTHA
jgi:hypothetical protein